MQEDFTPLNHSTSLQLPEARARPIWLFRIPRHVTSSVLEGAVVKLRSRKGREGKVVGRIDQEAAKAGGADLVFKYGDTAESSAFRALWTDEEGQLSAAGAFSGQVNVSLAPVPLPEKDCSGDEQEPTATVIEPYRGRQQLKGMRVRSRLSGAGTDYERSSSRGQAPASPPTGAPVESPSSSSARKSRKKARKSKASDQVDSPLAPHTPGQTVGNSDSESGVKPGGDADSAEVGHGSNKKTKSRKRKSSGKLA